MNPISFRAATAALFIATGRIPVGTIRTHAVEGTAEMALVDLAEEADAARGNALRAAKRIRESAEEYIARGAYASFDPINAGTVADLHAAHAKLGAIAGCFARLFEELGGLRFDAAEMAIHNQLGAPSLDQQPFMGEYLQQAAGVFALARAFDQEAKAVERARRAEAEAEAARVAAAKKPRKR